MKKLVVLAAFCAAMLPATVLGYDLVGLGQAPAKGQWTVSVSGGWLFEGPAKDTDLDSSLKNQGVSLGESDRLTGIKLENDRLWTAWLSYGLLQGLDVWIRAGIMEGGDLVMDDATGKLGSGFTYGLGARYSMPLGVKGLDLTVAAQYLRYDGREVKDWTVRGRPVGEATGYATDDEVDYWQTDAVLVVSYDLGRFRPYVGAGWSHWELSYSGKWHNSANGADLNLDAEMESKDWLLALAGVDMQFAKRWRASLAGVFVGRTALSLGIGWSF